MAQYCCLERACRNRRKYLKKGAKVYIEGKLKTRTWQDKDGKTDILQK